MDENFISTTHIKKKIPAKKKKKDKRSKYQEKIVVTEIAWN